MWYQRPLLAFGLSFALLAPAGAYAFDNDDYWQRRSRGYGYGRDRGYGSRVPVIDHVMRDIRAVAARNPLDGGDRRDLYRAAEELRQFQYRLSRGDWKSNHLDDAIDRLKDVAEERHVHPRDRSMLWRDVEILRDLRSSRGLYYGWR
jgi:hypothetical protein